MKKFIRKIIYRIRGEISTSDLIKRGMRVGKNFRRNENCIIDPSHCWLISIGDDVVLAPRVHILAHDASMWNALHYTKIAETKIGNNVFIGAGSIILPGVTIGNDVVIGAGSVVTKDVADNTVVAGNPAKVMSTYADFIEKHKKLMEDAPCFSEEYTLRNKNFTKAMREEQLEKVQSSEHGGYVE